MSGGSRGWSGLEGRCGCQRRTWGCLPRQTQRWRHQRPAVYSHTHNNQLTHSCLAAWLGHHVSVSEYVSLKSHNPSPTDALYVCTCVCVFSLCWFCSDCDHSWTVASGSESQCASAKAMTQLTTKSTHRVAKQTTLTRNKGDGKLVHFRLGGEI